MPYSTSNPPVCVVPGGMDGRNKLWFYRSTDAATAVRVSNYFTNGYALGMRTGDVLFQIDTDASPLTAQIFLVNAATESVTDVSDGVAITSTDTD